MEQQFVIATTVGTGPFKPAVRWNKRVWAHPTREFEHEDNALDFAKRVVTQVGDAINGALSSEDFQPTEE